MILRLIIHDDWKFRYKDVLAWSQIVNTFLKCDDNCNLIRPSLMTGQIMDGIRAPVRQYLWPGASVLTLDTRAIYQCYL